MAKKNNKTEDQFAQVEGALTKTEQFFEDNQKKIVRVFSIVIGVVALFLGYQNFYLEPLEKEAQTEMFNAEINFAKDSFNLALNGDDQYLGFIDIADDYSNTKAGKLANYYAGLSYLYLGEFENAIDYLEDFKSDDIVLSSLAIGCIGDAYLELDDQDKAMNYYKKVEGHHDGHCFHYTVLCQHRNSVLYLKSHQMEKEKLSLLQILQNHLLLLTMLSM